MVVSLELGYDFILLYAGAMKQEKKPKSDIEALTKSKVIVKLQ